ncbi:TRAP transporter substrate-binding protein DctP [Ruegeria atlantica]|uniref:TRAP transporter substrate-binding protein DctP n=1 Tax=Ruegeria atlantica TaxID=81569 RepID=UPI00147A4674|nr:TRAP transporter substrate-binding protein DctP [Ruegeria atlantica]
MLKRLITSCVVGATLVTAPVYADITLKGFIPAAPNRPDSKMVADFFQQAEEQSKDTLMIEAYYPGGLGFPVQDLIRHLERNTVQIAALATPYYTRELPGLSIALPDGVITDTAKYDKYIPRLKEMMETGLSDKFNLHVVGYIQPLFLDHSFFCSEPVATLAELRLKKVRVWTKHQLLAFQKLGVAAQIIPKEDLYVALQTGVIDCALFPAEIASTIGIQEVARHELRMMPWIAAPMPYVVNDPTWRALDDDQRSALTNAGRDSFQQSLSAAHQVRSAASNSRQERYASGFSDSGELSGTDLEEIQAALLVAWDEMAKNAGPDAEAVVARMKAD